MTPAFLTPASFALRPIAAADAPCVAALIRTAFAAITPPLAPPPSALRETADSVAAQIAAGGGTVAITPGEAGSVIGAVLWGPRDGGLYVGRLSVAAAARRMGVARALVTAAEQAARAQGFGHMHVGVRLALAGNRRLFAELGFAETVRHSHEGFTADTWVEMHKRLAV